MSSEKRTVTPEQIRAACRECIEIEPDLTTEQKDRIAGRLVPEMMEIYRKAGFLKED